MGTLLFLFAVVVEAVLVAFCLRTKSAQTRAKGFVRVGALAVFALLVSLQVIDWGAPYYALSVLLVLLAVTGVVGITRKPNATAAFRPGRVVFKEVGVILLFLLATMPAIMFPRYRPLEPTGSYKVSTASFTYADTSRVENNSGDYRQLNVGFWYPNQAGAKYPLVVFSHGGISDMGSNESLYRELASHGYVVASVNHTYQAITATDENGHRLWMDGGYLREILSEDAKTNRSQSYALYQKWMKLRMDDINFVLDHIRSEAGNHEADAIYRFIDLTAIGVVGHSLGGSAALGIGRIRADVGAVIALESPFMYDIKGVENGEFVFTQQAYPVPVLNIYSDSTWSRLGSLPQYAENYSLLSEAKAPAFNVHVSGLGHFSLTDLTLVSPILTRMLNGLPSTKGAEVGLRTVNRLCLQFLDSQLKKAGEFAPDGTY